MSDNIEFDSHFEISEPQEPPPLPGSAPPSETPSSAVTTTATMVDNVSSSIWPPRESTRDALRNRLIETLSTPSFLSKRYGTMSREDAAEAAKVIEDGAFQAVASAATATTAGDGIKILLVYSKEISRRTMETVKSMSGGPKPETEAKDRLDVEDLSPRATAPAQSEKNEVAADDE